MSEKKKKQIRRMGALPFVGLWTGAYALAWGLVAGIALLIGNLAPMIFDLLPSQVFVVLGTSFIGLATGVAQQLLIQHKFNLRLTGWWWKSVVVWAVTGLLWFNLLDNTAFLDTIYSLMVTWSFPARFMFVFSLLLVPPALIQSWLFRKDIQRVWLWPITALVGSASFSLPMTSTLVSSANDLMNVLYIATAGLLQGAIMGMVMIYLLNLTQRTVPNETRLVVKATESDHRLQHLVDDNSVPSGYNALSDLSQQYESISK